MNIAQAILANTSPRYATHDIGELLHGVVGDMERNLKHWLDKLEQCDTGYSADTLTMIRLESDAKALRALAERIEWNHMRLMKEDR